MADVVSPEKRSQMMAGIRAKDTKPELLLRSGLHKLGFRFRLHRKDLPGRPDLVLPRYNAVVFIHGCFWHGHGCHLFKWPQNRRDFWQKKIQGNQSRDVITIDRLRRAGWRVLIIWECSLRGSRRLDQKGVLQQAAGWIRSTDASCEILGRES